ncbi:C-type lectin 37Db-like [Drosophila nasuta]|uniref:C-type lectin 37Db-like n=1 Tax=Drosophila nasuta TaxID=42062 RepID=UPI00295E8548|nr:C-type lectin 37Db-like [Drosophila nasuta]
MVGKLGLLLIFLQICHFAMSNKTTPEIITQASSIDELESNFPLQIGKKFYRIEDQRVNWYKAAHICRQLGGNLLNIESSDEMDDLLSIIPIDRYWISAYCLAKDREFISIATGEIMPYFRWDYGEPNNRNGVEFCGEFDRTALNDNSCIILRKFICEAKIMY